MLRKYSLSAGYLVAMLVVACGSVTADSSPNTSTGDASLHAEGGGTGGNADSGAGGKADSGAGGADTGVQGTQEGGGMSDGAALDAGVIDGRAPSASDDAAPDATLEDAARDATNDVTSVDAISTDGRSTVTIDATPDAAPAVQDAALDSGAPDASDGAAPDGRSCVPALSSVQARWRAESNAKDETNVFNGTAEGALGYAPGRVGTAFLFDGATAAVSADPSDALYPPASFSIELWMKTSTARASTLISKYDCGASGCSGSYWGFDVDDTAHPNFGFRVNGNPTGVMRVFDTLHALADGKWHHLVGVRDVTAALVLLYVDGALAVSRPIEGADLDPISNVDGQPDPLTIGASRQSTVTTYTQFFAGAIDEAAYYNRALSSTQITAIYASSDGVCP